MLDVFRLAWFAVRTFFGVIALVLALYAALWLFVKILSAAPSNDEPGAALRSVESYNSQAASRGRATAAVPHERSGTCPESRSSRCEQP